MALRILGRRGSTRFTTDWGSLASIKEGNNAWVKQMTTSDPDYFSKLAALPHRPEYLFIGCSDSRVPSTSITGLKPGSMFVHRNVANLVVNNDMNLLSVLQYAVEVLEVKHIMVCGHYGCAGVKAAMEPKDFGLIENWFRNIRDVQRLHMDQLQGIADPDARYRRLVELNVVEQAINLYKTNIVQKSRSIRQGLPRIHGLCYDIHEGELRKLVVPIGEYHKKYGSVFNLDFAPATELDQD